MLTLVKNQTTEQTSIASEVQKLLQEKIDPKACLFEEHNTFFVAINGSHRLPGKLILGWGETIDVAIHRAIKNHEG